jgi:hypothetical protein
VNERIRTLAALATTEHTSYYDGRGNVTETVFDKEMFARLIVNECTQVLFDESERLFGLYSEETDMQQAERYELCSEHCTDSIELIEKHFGVDK